MQNILTPMRRRSLVLGAIGATSLALTPLARAQQKFINILTGGQSGVYYPLGVALSQIYAKVLPDAKVTVQSTKASAENLNLLQAGRGEIALVLGDALSDAWNGDKEAGFAPAPIPASRPWPTSRASAFRLAHPSRAPNSMPAPSSRQPACLTATLPRSSTWHSANRSN